MAVTEAIKEKANDITWHKSWRVRIKSMTPVGYDYDKGEARRYYIDKDGGYHYRPVSEAEMHRRT